MQNLAIYFVTNFQGYNQLYVLITQNIRADLICFLIELQAKIRSPRSKFECISLGVRGANKWVCRNVSLLKYKTHQNSFVFKFCKNVIPFQWSKPYNNQIFFLSCRLSISDFTLYYLFAVRSNKVTGDPWLFDNN